MRKAEATTAVEIETEIDAAVERKTAAAAATTGIDIEIETGTLTAETQAGTIDLTAAVEKSDRAATAAGHTAAQAEAVLGILPHPFAAK